MPFSTSSGIIATASDTFFIASRVGAGAAQHSHCHFLVVNLVFPPCWQLFKYSIVKEATIWLTKSRFVSALIETSIDDVQSRVANQSRWPVSPVCILTDWLTTERTNYCLVLLVPTQHRVRNASTVSISSIYIIYLASYLWCEMANPANNMDA